MSFLKSFPVILTTSNFMLFVIAIHFLILANSFWEAFDWLNYWMADRTYNDPVLFVRFFWIAESLLVLWWSKKRLKTTHLG